MSSDQVPTISISLSDTLKSANLEGVMVGKELLRLLSVFISFKFIPLFTGWDSYCIPRASRPWKIPYTVLFPQLSWVVAVVLISDLFMAIPSEKLSGIQINNPFGTYSYGFSNATYRTPVTVWHRLCGVHDLSSDIFSRPFSIE
jgi:hypothetical protein